MVLGMKVLNGKGEILSFGGEVMKNVAGYDVSRLMAGAMGTLGVILEVSLKVLPRPEREITLVHEDLTPASALEKAPCLGASPITFFSKLYL
jgi:glycolate oxidase FAD binding subunit